MLAISLTGFAADGKDPITVVVKMKVLRFDRSFVPSKEGKKPFKHMITGMIAEIRTLSISPEDSKKNPLAVKYIRANVKELRLDVNLPVNYITKKLEKQVGLFGKPKRSTYIEGKLKIQYELGTKKGRRFVVILTEANKVTAFANKWDQLKEWNE